MIAIKMDMPKDCESCRFNEYGCIFLQRIEIDEYEKTKNTRHKDCPLVDLGSEDMSWEELKEILKQYTLEKYKGIFILKIENEYIYFSSAKLQLFTFHKNGDIITDDMYKIFKNAKYYFMYQIIKALIGDER